MRDWFFYVVWYVRLKKLLLNYYCSEKLFEKELEENKEKYDHIVGKLKSGSRIESKEAQGQPEEALVRNNVIKMLSLTILVYQDGGKKQTKMESI